MFILESVKSLSTHQSARENRIQLRLLDYEALANASGVWAAEIRLPQDVTSVRVRRWSSFFCVIETRMNQIVVLNRHLMIIPAAVTWDAFANGSVFSKRSNFRYFSSLHQLIRRFICVFLY